MKKAQIQYMEMIFVLLILIVIIFLGMFLYFSFYTKSIEKKGEELLDIDATILTDSIVGMPEITCGLNCLDTLRIMLFDESKDSEYYKNIFRGMRIKVNRIYPTNAAQERCTTNNLDACGYFLITAGNPSENVEIIQSAVSLYYPESGKYEFGLIKIEVFK
ncbi:MAG: hypothetical protein AABX08_03015 [Nanoarchaeota archaeon]